MLLCGPNTWGNMERTALLEGFHRSAGNRYKVEPDFQISGILRVSDRIHIYRSLYKYVMVARLKYKHPVPLGVDTVTSRGVHKIRFYLVIYLLLCSISQRIHIVSFPCRVQ